MRNGYLFTSESVTEGHPDKLPIHRRDFGRDSLEQIFPRRRETISTGIAAAEEISTKAYVEIPDTSSATHQGPSDITDALRHGVPIPLYSVLAAIHQQSLDIAMGWIPEEPATGATDVRLRHQQKRPSCFNARSCWPIRLMTGWRKCGKRKYSTGCPTANPADG